MESESDNQPELMSFMYDELGDEKLIDITKEDDDLLSHSPLFDSLKDLDLLVENTNEHEGFNLSEFQPSQEVETMVEKLQQKEQNLLSCHDFVPARPSYMRKSLAWDSAFFSSAGILDSDELTFINEGFKTAEMQPPLYTCKRDAFSLSSSSRNMNIGIQNKEKTSASEGKNINNQRSVKNKTECKSKREESQSLPVKAPKVFTRMKHVLMGQSKSASVDYQAKVDNKNSAIGSGKSLKLSKKSAFGNSCNRSPVSLSVSEFSSVIASSSKDSTVSSSSRDNEAFASSVKVPSAFLKRKTESIESKLPDSTSSSEIAVRYLEKGKLLGNPRFSTQSLSISNNFSCTSPGSSSFGKSSSGPRSRAKQHTDGTEVHLDTQVQWSKHGLTDPSHVPTGSRKKLKPSCLRMPSPKIGFFDEEKSTTPIVVGRSLQLHFEMQGTPASNSGSSNRKLTPSKLVQARTTSSQTRGMKHVSRSTRILLPAQGIIKPRHAVASDGKLKSSSSKVWSTMKSGSDIGFRIQPNTCGEIEGKICSQCRKVSLLRRDDEGRRVEGRQNGGSSKEAKGQRTDPIIQPELSTPIKKDKNGDKQHYGINLHISTVGDKARTLASFEDQVNDLSRYFEVIDLSRDTVIENNQEKKDCPLSLVDNTISKLNGDNIFIPHDQKQDVLPNTFPDASPTSLPSTEFSPSSRTPLADKTSIYNASGLLSQSTTKEKLAENPSKFPCPQSHHYKENILDPYELQAFHLTPS